MMEKEAKAWCEEEEKRERRMERKKKMTAFNEWDIKTSRSRICPGHMMYECPLFGHLPYL